MVLGLHSSIPIISYGKHFLLTTFVGGKKNLRHHIISLRLKLPDIKKLS